MREIVHIQAGQCGNQIGAKVNIKLLSGVRSNRSLKHGGRVKILCGILTVFFVHELRAYKFCLDTNRRPSNNFNFRI